MKNTRARAPGALPAERKAGSTEPAPPVATCLLSRDRYSFPRFAPSAQRCADGINIDGPVYLTRLKIRVTFVASDLICGRSCAQKHAGSIHMPTEWPDDLSSYVLDRWREGDGSAHTIALDASRKFGIALTRSAILGKVHRKGWHELRPVTDDPHAPRPRSPGRPRKVSRLGTRPVEIAFPPAAPAPKYAPRRARPAPQTGRKTLEQLQQHDCRWPYGDAPPFMFCGQPVEHDRSYCSAHCVIAYSSPWARRS